MSEWKVRGDKKNFVGGFTMDDAMVYQVCQFHQNRLASPYDGC